MISFDDADCDGVSCVKVDSGRDGKRREFLVDENELVRVQNHPPHVA